MVRQSAGHYPQSNANNLSSALRPTYWGPAILFISTDLEVKTRLTDSCLVPVPTRSANILALRVILILHRRCNVNGNIKFVYSFHS